MPSGAAGSNRCGGLEPVRYATAVRDIVVVGGGMCGLAAAMMLADDGHRVTVLERDAAPPPPDVDAAASWARPAVAQFGLANWLLPMGTDILRRRLPAAYELLDANGGFRFNLVKYVLGLQPGVAIEPADDRFDLLTARRSTLEWVMATAADRHRGVEVRRGVPIAGLSVGAAVSDGVPHVDGVVLATGETVRADLVVDATGRRSATPAWLAGIGASAPFEESADSGFTYTGRYFRSADGTVPALVAPILSPIGSFSVLTLPADNGTWSVTLYGLSADPAVRRFRDPEVFERVVRACPRHAHWLDGAPTGELLTMGGIADRHRRFVVDGRPCATGVLTVGDASSCTNPSLGRGCSFGLAHVEVLVDSVAEHLGDPLALAFRYDERTETEIRPWHDATTALDRARLAAMRDLVAGRTPERSVAQRLVDALADAFASDPIATRAYGDLVSCTARPDEVFARAGVLARARELAAAHQPQPLPGPSRDQLLALVA